MDGGTQLGRGGREACGAGLEGWGTTGVGECTVVLSGAECVRPGGCNTGLGGHGWDADAIVLKFNIIRFLEFLIMSIIEAYILQIETSLPFLTHYSNHVTM